MFSQSLPHVAGLALAVSIMMAGPASADPLKDEIAPTGKLRVAIAISAAGGAFWCTKNETGGYAGVPVDLGKEMAAQLGVSVEYVTYPNSGKINGRRLDESLGHHLPAAGCGARNPDVVRPDL